MTTLQATFPVTRPGPERMIPLTYAPLPYDTHPVDTAPTQAHGWGPFAGAWAPEDFVSPFWVIDPTSYHGSANRADHGPGYADLTVFHDPSLSRVGNNGPVATLQSLLGGLPQARSSTAANTVSPTGTGVPSRRERIMSALGVNRGG